MEGEGDGDRVKRPLGEGKPFGGSPRILDAEDFGGTGQHLSGGIRTMTSTTICSGATVDYPVPQATSGARLRLMHRAIVSLQTTQKSLINTMGCGCELQLSKISYGKGISGAIS